jgi:hypothetical protein
VWWSSIIFVVLTPDARDLVAAEGRVRGVEVVAVRPDAAGLDARPMRNALPVSRVQTPAPSPYIVSSVVEGMTFSPVKAILAIRLFVASALPISAPGRWRC